MIGQACSWIDQETPCDPMVGIWNRRANLTGVHLRATYNVYKPNAMLAEDGSLTGFFPEVFYRLQEAMNFTYSLVPRASGGYGSRQASWGGSSQATGCCFLQQP